jgi:acetyl esterase/lipase
MKQNPFVAIAAAVLCLFPTGSILSQDSVSTRATVTVPLWPTGKMPGKGAKEGAVEHELPSRGDNVMRLTDITEPNIAVFQVPGAKQATPAVIICPGGAYGILAYDKEGTEIAAWLNSIGITGLVLKYRVPNNADGAFQDIQRAIRLVKKHEAQWNVAPNKIGLIGFSAGGHLCARLSSNCEKSTYDKLDAADDENIRPDFTILIYPAYLAVAGKISSQTTPGARTPPTFMVHTEDDKQFIAGSKLYHAALEEAKVPNGYFLCTEGGHGYGLRSKGEISAWPKKCQEWLVKQGKLQEDIGS